MQNDKPPQLTPFGNQVNDPTRQLGPSDMMPLPSASQAPNAAGVLDPSVLQMNQSELVQHEQNISSIPNLSKMAEFCATRGDYQ